MYSIIVVPGDRAHDDRQIRLAPGEQLRFGRAEGAGRSEGERRAEGAGQAEGADGAEGERRLAISHPGVSRAAGEITASGAFWSLSNLSSAATYVVENPEGAGEHIKISPGRIGAPVPFEFSRVVLPAGDELLSFDVWAPRHDYADTAGVPACDGEPTTLPFPLDRTKRYFHVLTALCEPRLRGAPHAPLPTCEQLVERLRPQWPAANRASVQWNIDYLAVKLRLKPGPETADPGPRLHGKRESIVSLALRFDLVQEDDLGALAGR
ncbi:FHA domain-containing protein [Streptomyces sp. PR69]|uniref:FHA domain-containing protein n=1 Tax=Streptomyces sp. PR69 TaxID=2984950 RepID=UPI002265121C|nr:FHA domain-containing protein [Streptomyces sp. PR69]